MLLLTQSTPFLLNAETVQYAFQFKMSLHILQIDFTLAMDLPDISCRDVFFVCLFFEHPKKSKVNMKKMPNNQEEEKGRRGAAASESFCERTGQCSATLWPLGSNER